MSILKEFREFAVKGNVVDMAVGIIIGAAFGKIVSSLVADVVMPPVGVLLGGVDFSNLSLILVPAVEGKAAVALRYGAFLQTVLDFLIVAAAVFVMIKGINRLKRELSALDTEPQPAEASPAVTTESLLTEIRDLLQKK